MIHLVVLAAGRGQRLGPHGNETPKWLLEVGGTTIADRQLEGVRRAPQAGVATVRVVVGHAAEEIARFAAERDPEIRLVDNPDYDKINNWLSLLLALRALGDLDEDERVVVFNADLLASPDWFAAFLEAAARTDDEALIAVDTARRLTDESMKVSGEDQLELIGKVGVQRPVGEYVGMLMARGAARVRLQATLESYLGDKGAIDNWYEHAVGDMAAAGVPWILWPTPDSRWIEIDDPADLESAGDLEGSP
jgi:choline kinase